MKRSHCVGFSVFAAAAMALAAAQTQMTPHTSAVTLSVEQLPAAMQVGLESDDPVSLLLRTAHPDGLQAWRLADAAEHVARQSC